MQYPIIDLMADAYLNNGWTGLNLVDGKNLAYIEYLGQCPSINSGLFIPYSRAMTTNRINIVGSSFTISIDSDLTDITNIYCFFYDNADTFLHYRNIYTNNLPQTITVNAAYVYVRIDFALDVTEDMIPLIQIEKGTQATPYEPYSEPKNDFPNRLKLPLPHYFPHPVIDALQRAAAGTQTADDTEILRHYLTPLGIGGI